MSGWRWSATRGSLALCVLIALNGAGKCDAVDRRLIGAWKASSDCEKIFERRAGRMQFRQPIDQFISAFVIDPNTVISSGAQCSIEKWSASGDVTTMALNCNNSIGYSKQDVRLQILSDTELIYGFPGNPSLDRHFEKCLP
jgi:hypothetical protein